MKVLVINLLPKTPFHFGERGVGLEETEIFPHSDTIFSAICWTWTLLYGEKSLEDELIEPFKNKSPSFILSSAFPYIEDIRFLPCPVSLSFKDKEKIKKVKYVSWKLFHSLNKGSISEETVFIHDEYLWLTESEFEKLPSEILDKKALAVFLKQWIAKGKKDKPSKKEFSNCFYVWKIGELPHVTVDRISSGSNIFHESDVFFSEKCGMYILVKFFNSEVRNKFLACLRLLGDEGLGGRRSQGRGMFEVDKIEEIELPSLKNADKILLLSLLNPDRNELSKLLSSKSAYKLIPRRGWVYSFRARNLRRKRVMMFSEGSIFNRIDKEIVGRLVPVLEKDEVIPHDVYRYGYGFFIPWSGGSDEISN